MDASDPRIKQLVKRVELFHGLSPNDVAKIYGKGMTLRVPKGETVFYKDTTGELMYVILGGKVGVFDGPKQLATLGVGATFGEMSLLNHEKRSATIVAVDDCSLFVLSEEVFQKLLTKKVSVQILMNLSRLLSKRISNANMTIRELEGR